MQVPGRRSFLDMAPPPNYVAGLGRGATGFTTRSDIGEARGENEQIMERGQHRAKQARTDGEGADEPMDLSESKFDKFAGYEGTLFGNTPYEQDDEEADLIYGQIDQHMDRRRKQRREQREAIENAKYREQNVKIEHQFADIKGDLKTLSETDWFSIPEVTGDRHWRKKKALEKNMPVPDKMIMSAYESEKGLNTTIDTPVGTETGISTNLELINTARTAIIDAKLERVGGTVTSQKSMDREGYMTELITHKHMNETEIGDFQKAEKLLESVVRSNPKEASGWLAAARLQEKGGKLAAARKIIKQGCQECPEQEDVWLEAARLAPPEHARSVLAEAVTHLPKAVKIWINAANLEIDVNKKKAIFRRALEFIPSSVKLWKEAVQLEEPEEARILLWRAVECVPDSTDLWLALARLEDYENAQKVLNKARQTIPTDPDIWIAASMLQEQYNNESRCFSIIQKAVDSLSANGVVINRDQWLEMAVKAEESGANHTCQAIIHNTIGMGVEDEDRKRVWLDDADQLMKKGHVETARAIYNHALNIFKNKKSVWLKAANLERERGTKTSLIDMLQKAVTYCPKAEVLWLMAAKEAWKMGDVALARQILENSFHHNPSSQNIWLAAVKIEWESKEVERTHRLLQKARTQCQDAPRVWLKSALLARWMNNDEEEYALLQEGTSKFPTYYKMWLMAAQFLERKYSHQDALETYISGLKECPKCVPLWISLAKAEERMGSVMKARAVYDKARLKVPANPQLWIESIRLENRANNVTMAKKLMAEALQECSTSGVLWYEAVELEPRTGKKAKLTDALKAVGEKDSYVLLAGARVFWLEGNEKTLEKARTWLNKACQYNPSLGDAWANLYKFEVQHGTEEKQQEVIKKCLASTNNLPRYGEKWISVSKGPQGHTLSLEQILKKAAVLV